MVALVGNRCNGDCGVETTRGYRWDGDKKIPRKRSGSCSLSNLDQ